MTVALIIAGGSGRRMGLEIPKQFVEVRGKTVLAYTLEAFERHTEIDQIVIVCIDGWQDEVRSWISKYGFSKLHRIVTGGATGQESIRNGLFAMETECADDDIAVVHDGIRPLVDEFVLSDVLRVCRLRGAAVTAMPYNEQIFVADDDFSTTKYIPRETLRRVATPQAYRFGLIDKAYHEAFEKGIGIHGSSYANTMMVELGHRLWFSAGSDKNIKLTTPDDLELFKGYLARKTSGGLD